MTLVFTICSVNYLAQARTLGDSLRKTNPNFQYVIGLVDKLSQANLPADLIPPYPMLEVDRIKFPEFAAMCDRYDIIELNTAVKPFFIDYLFETYPDVSQIIYFDPDIIVYQSLLKLSRDLSMYSMVLTPHICSPVPDWEQPNEQHHLNTGIYNLGFIGLRRDATARQFVNWWKARLVYECRIDLCAGLFVDQLWVNFAPVYHDNVLIEHHPGYNVAYWNLHERWFSTDEAGQWCVGGQPDSALSETRPERLQFFHYSGYNPDRPDEVSKYQTRYSFLDRPDAKPLFDIYRQQLQANSNDQYRQYPCVYIKPPVVPRYQRVRRVIKEPFDRIIAFLES